MEGSKQGVAKDNSYCLVDWHYSEGGFCGSCGRCLCSGFCR